MNKAGSGSDPAQPRPLFRCHMTERAIKKFRLVAADPLRADHDRQVAVMLADTLEEAYSELRGRDRESGGQK